jgi:hypothetical protein
VRGAGRGRGRPLAPRARPGARSAPCPPTAPADRGAAPPARRAGAAPTVLAPLNGRAGGPARPRARPSRRSPALRASARPIRVPHLFARRRCSMVGGARDARACRSRPADSPSFTANWGGVRGLARAAATRGGPGECLWPRGAARRRALKCARPVHAARPAARLAPPRPSPLGPPLRRVQSLALPDHGPDAPGMRPRRPTRAPAQKSTPGFDQTPRSCQAGAGRGKLHTEEGDTRRAGGRRGAPARVRRGYAWHGMVPKWGGCVHFGEARAARAPATPAARRRAARGNPWAWGTARRGAA